MKILFYQKIIKNAVKKLIVLFEPAFSDQHWFYNRTKPYKFSIWASSTSISELAQGM